MCQFDRVPSFLVKGICTGGPNWIYYLVQDDTGHFFEGYKRDKIMKTEESWTLITADGKRYISLDPWGDISG